MPRTALLVVAALATAAVLVPTGAVPFDTTGSDSVTGELALQPADGPNGDYAVLNEDEELELLLTGANPALDSEGVNANSVTPLPRVFTITYTGEQSATVWLTDDAEDVRFYRGEDSDDTLEGRANSVVLAGEESVSVGLLVDTRGDHDVEDASSFTVHGELADDDTRNLDGAESDSGGDDSNDGGTGDEGTTGDGSDTNDGSATGDGSDGGSSTGDSDDGSSTDDDSTPEPTETGSVDGDETEASNERGGVETPTSEATPTATQTPELTASADAESDSGGIVEIGGVVLGPLLAIVGMLAVLLCLLAGIRLYR